MRRYEALDSLRGICACGVVFYHFNAPGWLCGSPVARGGEMFVDFFFVLSGFVIAASYGQRLRKGFSLGRFMGLRFGQVYPLHLAMLLVFVAMELVALVKPSLSPRPPFTGARSLQHLADNVFLLEATGLSGGPSWNTPSWSICVEFWTYLIAALVLRFSRRWLWPVLGALMAGAAWQLAHGDHYLLDTVSLGCNAACWALAAG
jgi:peptidoglycan/LPS O-acetylase OafA/YrhL